MTTETMQTLHNFFSKQKLLSYKKGEVIIREDDEPSGVYYLSSGFVRLGATLINGGELTFNIFKPGSFFPMMWAIGDTTNAYFCQALSEVKLYRVPKPEVVTFVKENPDVLFDLTKRILIGMDGLLKNIQHLMFGSSENRVAAAILMLVRRFGEKNAQGQVIIGIDLTHQDISLLAGVTRETTSIAMKQLERRGLIKPLKKRYIVSINKLEEEIMIADHDTDSPLTI